MAATASGDGRRTTEIRGEHPRTRRNWALLLFVPPFVALLYVPFYARIDPELWGIPFFVWYQFAWIVVGSVLTYVVYLLRR